MEHLGAKDAGPDIGKYRPIRSDEWSVNTALIQSMDRNNFQRYNTTSFYKEDLRINYGLPIHDWGIIFKPTMWLYGVVPSAYAYSFHWYAVAVLFILGYATLFKKFNFPPLTSTLISLNLFFTGQVQFWWNEKGPIFAIFPWIIITIIHFKKQTAIRFILLYWICTTWLLTNLYPPIQISLAFVAVILFYAYFPQEFTPKNSVLYSVAIAASAATAAFYLIDYLIQTSTTIYPGSRVSYGGEARRILYASWWFPALLFDHKYEIITANSNICEIGTVGIYFSLFTLIFLNYKNIAIIKINQTTTILLLGFFAMAAWMYIPLPHWAGYPFLWNRVPGERMEFAAGLLWVALVLQIANTIGLKWSLERTIILLLLLLAAAGINPKIFGDQITSNNIPIQNLIAPLIVLFAIIIYKVLGNKISLQSILLSTSVIAGFLFFGRFNPLQSAKPIFAPPQTPMMRAYTNHYHINNDLFIHQIGLGATANGLGFRSVPHINPTPHMDVWSQYFPELSDKQRTDIFNRYAHIYLEEIQQPEVKFLDAVKIPINKFQHQWQTDFSTQLPPKSFQSLQPIGFIDEIKYQNNAISITGWGGWLDNSPNRLMKIYSPYLEKIEAKIAYKIRSDLVNHNELAKFGSNGFQLTLTGKIPSSLNYICLVAYDADTGKSTPIQNPAGVAGCNTPQEKK